MIKKLRRRLSTAFITFTIVMAVLETVRRLIAGTMVYVPESATNWLIAAIAIVGLLFGTQMYGPPKRQRGKSFGRVVRRIRYARAVRAMQLRDDYGRPVAS